jgi:hypothetical protein
MAAAEAFGPAAATFISLCKFATFFWSMEKFYDLIKSVNSLTSKGVNLRMF